MNNMNLEFNSLKYMPVKTLKELYQSLQSDTAKEIQLIEDKINAIQSAFNNNWNMDEHLFKKQFYNFVNHCKQKNEFDVINFAQVDTYWHLKINIVNNNEDIFKNKTKSEVYRIFYHITLEPLFLLHLNKYVLSYIIDEQYISYIIFTENDILNVQTIMSENMYDLNAIIFLSDVDLKGKIFTKISE